ncbi:MAG TPA: DUF3108 domain-containing protein [Alphaproteobacteria bacterium]
MRFVLPLLLCLIAAPAWAESAKATYGLYTGGVKMIDVTSDVDIGSQSYTMKTVGATTGIFKTLLPWTGTFDTTGEGNFLPTKHTYAVAWRGDSETLTFNYEKPGVLKSVTKTKEDGTVEDATPEADISDGTRDLLSALGMMMKRYADTGKCAGDTLVFDGKRSLTVQIADAGDTTMNNAELSVYQGPAHGCAVKIIQGKGKWPKKPRGWMRIQQMGEKDGKLPIIWLAKPINSGPVMPVRIDIHTKYGDVIAHLTSVQ